MTEALRLIPLGGLGEIGMNSMLVAYGRDAIMIDCGVLFPDPAEMPGVDVVIPDFSKLKELDYELHAYVITHGHEDHIGALPYALQVESAPIYASRFTSGLVKHKLDEWGFKYDLHEIKPRDELRVGPFMLEFLRVTHSIPDGLGIAIGTPIGTIIHTGDFKIDHAPVGGETTDLARFAEYGERGVLALLSDSTNSESEGVSMSETAVGENLRAAMRDVDGRIILASFASHIHRLQQVIALSTQLGRKVALSGRSMINNVRLARELRMMSVSDDALMPLDEVKSLPSSKVTVLTTGSQAEPGSGMSKLSLREHPELQIEPGDVVIFSSRSIPGNEKAISKAINGLTRQGARVLYGHSSKIHTSGHAHREEQRLMLNLVKPRYFLPVHGELRHLAEHARTAIGGHVPAERVFVLEDGQSVVFEKSGDEVLASHGPSIEARKIMVDGKGVGDVGDVVLRDRQQLSYAGMLICVVSFDAISGEVVGGPELVTRGIVQVDQSGPLLDEAKAAVLAAIAEHTAEARRDRPAMEEAIRLSLRRFFRKRLERKPVVLPLVLQV